MKPFAVALFLLLPWVRPFAAEVDEAVLRTKLGLERSAKINTAADPRNSIRHCFHENTVFIHSDFHHIFLAIDLNTKVTQFNIKLADSVIQDCFVHSGCLALRYRGAPNFAFYNAKTGALRQSVRFPFDLGKGGIDLFAAGLCLIQDPSDSTIQRIFAILQKGPSFSFKETSWFEYGCLTVPFIDLKTAKHFPAVSYRYYLGQDEDFLLLKDTPGDPAAKEHPSFYLYVKKLSYFKRIALPSEKRRDFHFATLHRGAVYLQEYDFGTNEFVLYKYAPEKPSATATFDPKNYAAVKPDSVFLEKVSCDK